MWECGRLGFLWIMVAVGIVLDLDLGADLNRKLYAAGL